MGEAGVRVTAAVDLDLAFEKLPLLFFIQVYAFSFVEMKYICVCFYSFMNMLFSEGKKKTSIRDDRLLFYYINAV